MISSAKRARPSALADPTRPYGRPRQTPPAASLTAAREVAAAREALKFTPEGFAEFLGTHLRTVQRWESGDRPIPDYLWTTLALMYSLDRQPAPRGHRRLPISASAAEWIRARTLGPEPTP